MAVRISTAFLFLFCHFRQKNRRHYSRNPGTAPFVMLGDYGQKSPEWALLICPHRLFLHLLRQGDHQPIFSFIQCRLKDGTL